MARIPTMTLLKLLATALVALTFLVIASPGYAANDGDGVTNGSPNNPPAPAARPRRHHHEHKHQRHGQRHHRRHQNPDLGPAPGESDQG